MLSPRERVRRAVAHEETEIVPYKIPVHPRARVELVKAFGEDYEKSIIEHFASTGPLARLYPAMGQYFTYVDLTGIEKTRKYLQAAEFPREYIDGFFATPDEPWMDDFGCVWLQSSSGAPHVVKHALSEPDLRDFEFPDYSNSQLCMHIPEEIEDNRGKFFVAGAGVLFYERAWAMRGFQQILIDFYRHPVFVEELLDNLVELNIQMAKEICRYSVDAVLFSDDFGMQKGLIMGAKIWRKFLKPRLKQIYGSVKKSGKLVMIHSCGDNSAIMSDLIEIGVDIFNPTQPEAMDIYELKRKYGSQITFYGGIPSQRLPFYTPEQIRKEVIKTRSVMSENGGFVLSPTKEIRWDTPIETAMALIKEIVNPGRSSR
jgi:uroporphyrinogen decarboxylase